MSESRAYTILVSDNIPDHVHTRAAFLQDAGYSVVKAFSILDARNLLSDAHIHLAILDIRMINDDDEKDTSGITLAKDPVFQLVPKIILTGFPTYEAVREALGPVLDGLPPAVDFLSKQEGSEAMVQAVKQALDKYVHINRDLEIHWDEHQRPPFPYLAGLLQPDAPDAMLLQRAEEIEDLFRRLFYDYRHLRITHLFWHGSERLCLSVLAQSAQGATDARVVVCGNREPLAHEIKRVRELAPGSLQGIRLDSTSEMMHFGAAAYELPDTDLETVRPLRALLDEGKERSIKAAFHHLLASTLPAWHQRGQTVADQDLLALYRQKVGLGDGGLPRDEVERRVEAMVQATRAYVDVRRSSSSLIFHFPLHPPLVYPDPIAAAYGCLEGYDGANRCCISPGQLTPDNVLVDRAQQTWLTNFAQAGQAPLCWDFACLEALVRFDLSEAPDLVACLEFEECLTQAAQLNQRLPVQDVVPGLKINVALIEMIRRAAGGEAGTELLPYEAGLLVRAVAAMARHDPGMLFTQAERMRGAHLLLTAALLAGHLGELVGKRGALTALHLDAGQDQPQEGLRLDADGVQVWLGQERTAALTGQELELFRCLYEHVGKVVPRKALVERVHKEPYEPGNKYQEGNLNALVRRLRQKIEPTPEKPRYLLTVRGQGYRLEAGDTTRA